MWRLRIIWCCLCYIFVTLINRSSCNVLPTPQKNEFINQKAEVSTDMSYKTGFFSAAYIIILSELGDKTFFIAAILSANNPRLIVYGGFMGYAINFVPIVYTTYLSAVLYLIFGLKIIYDGYHMKSEDAKDEYEEVQQNLSLANSETDKAESQSMRNSIKIYFRKFFHPVLIQSFILCFIAEWGDRSQIATVILAATKSVSGVVLGAILGHALCSGLAVLAGRLISYKVPVKWLTIVGGFTFLVFSFHSFYEASNASRHTVMKDIETALNTK